MKLKLLFHSHSSFQILVLFLVCIFKESLGEFLWRSPYSDLNSLCNLCGSAKTTFINNHCKTKNYHVFARCCLDSRNHTVGIDLGNCNVTALPDLNVIKDVSWINLAQNPKLNCSTSAFHNAFKGFQKLQLIVLPSLCHNCPGGNGQWNDSKTQDNSITCTQQLDDCVVMNRTCPTNSKCVSNGPGFYECLCKADYFGYKCLIIKGMPLLAALCGIAGATILVTVPICFLINRRKNMHKTGYVVIE